MGFSEYVRFHGHHVADDVLSGEKEASSAERARLKKAYWSYLDDGGFIAAQNLVAPMRHSLCRNMPTERLITTSLNATALETRLRHRFFFRDAWQHRDVNCPLTKSITSFAAAGLTIGRESLSRLLGYYEEAYLLFSVKNYSTALADNARSAAKVYAADPALFGAFSPSSAIDVGQELRNGDFQSFEACVILDASWSHFPLSFRGRGGKRHEIDFVVGDALLLEPLRLVQVSVSLDDSKTRKRELAALEAGMRKLQAQDAVIVTADEEAEIETSEGVVRVVPAWKWLLD